MASRWANCEHIAPDGDPGAPPITDTCERVIAAIRASCLLRGIDSSVPCSCVVRSSATHCQITDRAAFEVQSANASNELNVASPETEPGSLRPDANRHEIARCKIKLLRYKRIVVRLRRTRSFSLRERLGIHDQRFIPAVRNDAAFAKAAHNH